MSNKRLTPEQLEEIKQMVINGVYPDDIAKHFGVAVSSVHNYKNRFKLDGITFPSIKGKKPHNAPKPDEVSEKINVISDFKNGLSNHDIIGVLDRNDNKQDYKFIIGGLSVIISKKAKTVTITDDHVEIKF
jgi:DNA-binding NarL/FixJ family response regulator